MNDEEKNSEIPDLLKNLPKVKAGEDFMQKLEMKIADYESGQNAVVKNKADRESFLNIIFGKMKNPWLVPAAGIAVAAVFVFYISNFNKNEIRNVNDPVETEGERNIDKKNPGQNNILPPDTKENNQISVPGAVKEPEDLKYNNRGTSPQNDESRIKINSGKMESQPVIQEKPEDTDGAVMESRDEDSDGGELKAAPHENTGLYKKEDSGKNKIKTENPVTTEGPESSFPPELSTGDSAQKSESDSLVKSNRISKKNLDSLKKKIDK